MAARVQYAAILVDALHVDVQLLKQQVNLAVSGERRVGRTSVEHVAHLLEYPRTAERGTTHHHRVHAVAVERVARLLGRADVTVADDGDVYARVALHFADERPVGVARVHLRARSAVYGERLYAAVLQRLRQVADDELFVVPSQARLHRDGRVHRLHHLARDV